MANKRLNLQEKFRIITECRQSGLSDQQWCLEHGIKPSTFYNWVSKLRKLPDLEIPESKSKLEYLLTSKQDVVPLEIISEEHFCGTMIQTQTSFTDTVSDSSHTIEVTMGEFKIRFTNSIDPNLLEATFRCLKGIRC